MFSKFINLYINKMLLKLFKCSLYKRCLYALILINIINN